jgi:uncharacterized protein YaiE (UPF0345 family)
MSRSRDLANLAGDATGLETLTVSDITDLTATATELNYVDGVTSAVQTQLTQLDSQTSPHIIPGVLYPAVGGNDLSGTALGGSYVYGTAHTDNRKYYYTDIKGSKPIKDPRIGGHFGSQRHKFKSLQLLEQETATHGENVYSVDGREWIRGVGDLSINNNSRGNFVFLGNDGTNSVFMEITGYFNDVNILMFNEASRSGYDYKINGGSNTATDDTQFTAVTSPLDSRYVDAMAVHNINIGTISTPAIQTLKITRNTSTNQGRGQCGGIELIAQDTSNRNNIQIPSQDVVSYGKKFNVSGTPHYNPFNNQTIGDNTSHGKNTVGWTTYDSTLDTATSLGLDAWVDSGNYYRPVNGGRIVKWVDSSGNIKTSVNMMPPSAKAIGSHSGNSGPHETAWTSTYQPVFSSGSVDHTQAEVAKTFHFREFGNGSANEGTGGANYADASMINTADSIAYVMDDGLTSLSGTMGQYNQGWNLGATHAPYVTFIGTGITISEAYWDAVTVGTETLAQNLPYGTHVIKFLRDGSNNLSITLDGVEIYNVQQGLGHQVEEITFHQPKKPPIPEDACVIADYMLMADFVPQSSAGVGSVSKGSRVVNCSRDLFYDASSGSNVLHHGQSSSGGFKINSNTTASAGVYFGKIPAFGTNFLWKGYDVGGRGQLKVNGSNATQTTTTGGSFGHVGYISSGSEPNLGVNTFEATNKASQELMIEHFEIATPIHTSSHYQPFETPFLYELVGGDRNMEQTNLVVSPDGRTWDEVTRDVSYIGHEMLKIDTSNGNANSTAYVIFNKFRGQNEGSDLTQKNFAIGYDRFICLRDGMYEIYASTMKNINTTYHANIWVNETRRKSGHSTNINHDTITNILTTHLKRGDYVRVEGGWYASAAYSHFHIIRLEK